MSDKENDIITEVKAYELLKEKLFYWNFDKLKEFKSNPMPEYNLKKEKNDFLDLFDKVLKPDNNYIIFEQNYESLKEFVEDIYYHTKKYSDEIFENKQFKKSAKVLLAEIFEILNKTNSQEIEFHTSAICEKLKSTPEDIITELRISHQILTSNYESNGSLLNDFIRAFIAVKKEEIFDFSVTPTAHTTNIGTVRYWRNEFKAKLGLSEGCSTGYNIIAKNDKFRRSPGNALREFFSNFTPEYIISRLTYYINERELLKSEALKWLNDNQNSIHENKIKDMMALNQAKKSDGNNSGSQNDIPKEFTEYYLINVIGIVKKNNNKSLLNNLSTSSTSQPKILN